MTAPIISKEVPWPRDINQNALVLKASRAVKSACLYAGIFVGFWPIVDSVGPWYGIPSGVSPMSSGRWSIIRVSGQATIRTIMPEAAAVMRQPTVSSEKIVMGTSIPPNENPNCDSASAFARCFENQLTSAVVTERNPPRLVPSAIKKK